MVFTLPQYPQVTEERAAAPTGAPQRAHSTTLARTSCTVEPYTRIVGVARAVLQRSAARASRGSRDSRPLPPRPRRNYIQPWLCCPVLAPLVIRRVTQPSGTRGEDRQEPGTQGPSRPPDRKLVHASPLVLVPHHLVALLARVRQALELDAFKRVKRVGDYEALRVIGV